jgi:sugar (pentulose or hexulose) kinase
MKGRATVVLDVGKTLSKLSLWAPGGRLMDRRRRQNDRIPGREYVGLDAAGIEAWLAQTLRDFARAADVGAIVPVAHGAAAAIIGDGALARLPLDYEHPIPAHLRREYDAQREPFTLTGSPALPDGLNLGAQLHYLESLDRSLLSGKEWIVPWPQYWSWRLSGVAASEVTSLGCHTDLWHPIESTHSSLAIARGWAARMAPLQSADAVLDRITPEWAVRTGLSRDVEIHCGVHDSNAALLAARGFPELAACDFTVLSTGTWFVAMRTPARDAQIDLAALPEARDCLVNVDVFSKPVPSARFMGGREIDLLTGPDIGRVDLAPDQPALIEAVEQVLAQGTMALPTFAPAVGPFANCRGRWTSRPEDATQRRAAVCLYAALVSDASLDLIGARDRLLVEGRFAGCEPYVRALATLRPETAVYVSHDRNDVSFGALRLVDDSLGARESLVRVTPLPYDLSEYRARWHSEIVAHTDHDCGSDEQRDPEPHERARAAAGTLPLFEGKAPER